MINQQFLTIFEKHLYVGGPQRAEIIAELRTHLEAQSADKLGDPKQLAGKMNWAHLGVLSSPRRVVLTLFITVLLFDVITPWLLMWSGLVSAGTKYFINIPIVWSIAEATTYLSTVVFIYACFHVYRMRFRWIGGGLLVVMMLFGYSLSVLIGLFSNYFASYNVTPDPLSIWALWWTSISYSSILYASIGLLIFFIAAGKGTIFPKHAWIDVVTAFIILSAGVYYLLPYLWNVITAFHYTEYMYYQSIPYFQHLKEIAILFGLLGASIEIIRILHINRFRKVLPKKS